MSNFSKAVSGGDQRKAYEAIRDSLVEALDRPPCKECGFSGLSAPDRAALTLRLTKVMETLAALPPDTTKKELSGLEAIQARRGGLVAVSDESEVASTATLGTKKAPRGARSHGNRPRVIREA